MQLGKAEKGICSPQANETTSFWMFMPSWFQAQDSVER